jgi:hypothetical protein
MVMAMASTYTLRVCWTAAGPTANSCAMAWKEGR